LRLRLRPSLRLLLGRSLRLRRRRGDLGRRARRNRAG